MVTMAENQERAKERQVVFDQNLKTFVMLVGMMVIMAVSNALQTTLGSRGAWTVTGDIFTDYTIYYLDILPIWIIVASVWMMQNPSIFKVFRWILTFFCGFWLPYDWIWWAVRAGIDPASFSWTSTFYFSVILPRTTMYAFLTISIVGFLLSIYLLKTVEEWEEMVPFALWLAYIYVLGGIGQVVAIPDVDYIYWSVAFIPAIAVSFWLTYHGE